MLNNTPCLGNHKVQLVGDWVGQPQVDCFPFSMGIP